MKENRRDENLRTDRDLNSQERGAPRDQERSGNVSHTRDSSLEETISNQRTSSDLSSDGTTKNLVAGSDLDGQL